MFKINSLRKEKKGMHKDLINNKYAVWYSHLIEFRKNNTPSAGGFTEIHHILPRSMGGSDSDSNLVVLTIREHFVAHLLLAKMFTGSSRIKMATALRLMAGENLLLMRSFNSKKYELARSIAKQQYQIASMEIHDDVSAQKSALDDYVDFEKLKEVAHRGLCKVCRIEPRAVNYIKNGRTYYRTKCESCNSGKEPKTPKWIFEGYEKKQECEDCGFKAKFSAQLTVRAEYKIYKTVCLNCQVGFKLSPKPSTKLKPDF